MWNCLCNYSRIFCQKWNQQFLLLLLNNLVFDIQHCFMSEFSFIFYLNREPAAAISKGAERGGSGWWEVGARGGTGPELLKSHVFKRSINQCNLKKSPSIINWMSSCISSIPAVAGGRATGCMCSICVLQHSLLYCSSVCECVGEGCRLSVLQGKSCLPLPFFALLSSL